MPLSWCKEGVRAVQLRAGVKREVGSKSSLFGLSDLLDLLGE